MKFELNETQIAKFKAWEAKQDAKVVEKQRNSDDPFHRAMAEHGPYYGAIGGAYEFAFVPTSLGMAITVRNLVTDEELNLTDFDSW